MRKVGVFLAVGLAGCGGSLVTGLFDASTGNDAGSDATVIDDGVPDVTSEGMAEAEACALGCSADLHSIVDCYGNAVQMCPADQGCSGGACEAACAATDADQHFSGCEFYSVVPDVIPNNNLEGGCYAVALTNAWSSPMTVTVDVGGTAITGDFRIPSGTGQSMTYGALPSGQVPAGATALLFLSASSGANPACPTGVTPGMTTDPAAHGTAYGTAFHIKTSMPAVAADYVPYGSTAYIASASLLLPTHAWTTNYVVVDAYAASNISGGVPSTDIVALADSTHVTIKPTANITASGTVTGATAGTSTVYTLNKGQVLQVSQSAELTGSPIQSDNPIAVWGAHTCINIDPNTMYCDSGHQQLPPVSMIGHDYVGVRYRNRVTGTTTDETPPWRLVGLASGTTLTWDPAITGAPASLTSGQLASVSAAGPFRVYSQDALHPFYISAHMTGGEPFSELGDPEFVNVVPTAQWQNGYTFFTEPAFPETNLVLVRAKGTAGFQDVTLDCAGTLTGWANVDSAGLYQFTRIDLSTGDYSGQNGCDNGTHTASSAGPFTLTTWGWGNSATNTYSVSYAAPAGMNTLAVTSITVPAK